MYNYQIEPFDPYEAHVLSSQDGQFSCTFVPQHGTLQQIRLHGKELLAGAANGQELKLNRWAKGNLLFPFPNRLSDGQFTWKGETYQFPINDSNTSNALHGFFGELSFQVSNHKLEEGNGMLELVHRPVQPPSNYPFHYEIKLKIRLSQSDGFWIDTQVTNLGTIEMPVSWGWHPYFQLEGMLESWKLRIPTCHFVGIDERMLPTGKLYAYGDFSGGAPLGSTILDNCFKLDAETDQHQVQLENERGLLTYYQERKYPFVQFFIPPDRASIAIEPMTSNIDGLNSGDGLLVLGAGEKANAGWGVQYRPTL